MTYAVRNVRAVLPDAVLAVFHDLDAMARLATRVVLMSDGQIAQQGPPETVLGQLTGVAR